MTPAEQTRRLIAACRSQGCKIETSRPLYPRQLHDLLIKKHHPQRPKATKAELTSPEKVLPSRAVLRKQCRCIYCGEPARYTPQAGFSIDCEACSKEMTEKRQAARITPVSLEAQGLRVEDGKLVREGKQ